MKDILNKIVEQSLESKDVLKVIQSVLLESGFEKSKVLLYIPQKNGFQSVDGNPVFTSTEFISLFESLAQLGKPFIVGGNTYFPLIAHDKIVGCIMTQEIEKMSEQDKETLDKISKLYSLFASSGVDFHSGFDSEEMLFNNRNIIFGEIAGGVLHDLNNIIGAILGRAQLAKLKYKRNPESEILFSSLDTIEKISLTGGKISQRLKNFARMSETLEVEDVNLSFTLNSALEMIEHKIVETKMNRGIDFKINNEIDDDIEISTAPVLLEEVMFNILDAIMLVLNEGGQIDISARRDPYNATVTFQLYGKLASISTIEPELRVVKNLLAIQGGVFENSELGKFIFTIQQSNLATSEKHDEINSDFKGFSTSQRVLLVEDNDGMRVVLEEILDGMGCDVVSVATGEDGLSSFRKGDFDAVLTDLGLPDIDGKELALIIKKTHPNQKIAAITGWQDRADSIFDATITKPFNIDEIFEFLDDEEQDDKTIVFFRKDVS